MAVVKQIRVVWNNPAIPPPPLRCADAAPHKLVVERAAQNTLLNRYAVPARADGGGAAERRRPRSARTACARCSATSRRTRARSSGCRCARTRRSACARRGAAAPALVLLPRDGRRRRRRVLELEGQLNLVHRDYLRAFVDELPRHLHAFIASHKPTCEDLMLNFLVANATHRRPSASCRTAAATAPRRRRRTCTRRRTCGRPSGTTGGRAASTRSSPPSAGGCRSATRTARSRRRRRSTLPPRGSGLLGEPNASRAAFHKGRAERLQAGGPDVWAARDR